MNGATRVRKRGTLIGEGSIPILWGIGLLLSLRVRWRRAKREERGGEIYRSFLGRPHPKLAVMPNLCLQHLKAEEKGKFSEISLELVEADGR